ncbi:cupin domain-containing protein [Citricoccus parietis]
MRPVGPAPRPERNPLLVYTKAQADDAMDKAKGLAPDPVDDVILEYQNPAGGGSALPSMSMKSQIVRPGFTGLQHRHSGSKVYYALSGSASMVVKGERFDWGKGDFISVPPYAAVTHLNEGTEEGRLFRVDDSPIFRMLNAYHEEILTEGETAK